MAPYDSESSADEDDDYTETNVLLGYASKDPGDDDNTSRLGGRPEWLDPNKSPSAALARCKICKDLMVLLLQLNGELPDRFPGHERRLYVFSCKKKGCRRREGSIRALRSVRIAPGSAITATSAKKTTKKEDNPKPKEEAPRPPSTLGETLFGAKTMGSSSGSANPFATSTAPSNPFASSGNPFSSPPPLPPAETKPESQSETSGETDKAAEAAINNLPKTFAETLSLNNDQAAAPSSSAPSPPPEPWPPASDQPPPYPISYLWDAAYETLDPTPPAVSQQTAATTTRMDIDSGPSGGKEDRDAFESTMDAAFQRFADRLAQNPEQAIRYEFGGAPLLYSKTDAVGRLLLSTTGSGSGSGSGGGGMPRCGNCGAPRAFEVQLVPRAIAELEADEMSLDGMDWGTVIVGVCERDCQARGVGEGEAGYLEEWAGVQWEELGGGGGGGARR
ncbi:programmed cell death protein 2 [Xylariaceae sp. FL0662B]|nr:programmed cell death protein 2 [Xylariaceae sp. FL0662B]